MLGEPWKGYYLTAYGIAVKHGFVGTEEEWLRSLEGKQGDPGAAAQLRYNATAKAIEWKAEGSGTWKSIVKLSELQGEVVTATLSEVQEAAENAGKAKTDAEKAAEEAAKAKEMAELSVGKTSYIGENGNWYAWNGVKEIFYDTGIRAQAGSLVYYGDNPPEDVGVWIDPNGESCTFAPYIGENGNWYTFDASREGFADSGVCAIGRTPQKGTDYWTETEKDEFVQDVLKAMPDGDEVEY